MNAGVVFYCLHTARWALNARAFRECGVNLLAQLSQCVHLAT